MTSAIFTLAVTLIAWLAVWLCIRQRRLTLWMVLFCILGAVVLVLICARTVQLAILTGYPDDSFWSLGLGGRAGVCVISTVGLSLVFLLLFWKSRFFIRLPLAIGLPLDLVAGLLIYSVIYSLSPQAYYTLYQFVFPDLPIQIVIRYVLDPDLPQIATLPVTASMSDHLAGLALWAVLPFTLWVHLHKRHFVT